MKVDAKAGRFRVYGIPKILMITISFFPYSPFLVLILSITTWAPTPILQFCISCLALQFQRDSEWNKVCAIPRASSLKGRRIISTTFFIRFLMEIALMSEPSMLRFFPFLNSLHHSPTTLSSPHNLPLLIGCQLHCTSMDESVINVLEF